jgi:hypothetical protein
MMLWRRVNAFVRRQNPWIGVVGILLSIALAIYLAIPEKGVLGYRQSVIKIFDSKAAGTMRLLEPNGQPVEDDVYAVETALANAGNVAFDESRIRRGVEIRFPGGKVVQTSVSASADPDITQFTVSRGPAPDVVQLKWRNFDPGQFVKITTLVASPVEVKPEINGTIFGVKLAEAITSPYPTFLVVISAVGFAVLFGAIAFSSFSGAIGYLRERRFTKACLVAVVGTGFVVLCVLFLAGTLHAFYAPQVP